MTIEIRNGERAVVELFREGDNDEDFENAVRNAIPSYDKWAIARTASLALYWEMAVPIDRKD